MRKFSANLLTGGLLTLVLVACGGGDKKDAKSPEGGRAGRKSGGAETAAPVVDKRALERYNAALDAFNAHDKQGDWNDAACNEVAAQFDAAANAQTGSRFAEARYNAGLAYQKCDNDKAAKAAFEHAMSDTPKFHYARAELALYRFKADGNIDAAISELEGAVSDAEFRDVPALVDLAMFQMQRDSEQIGANCQMKVAGKEVDLKDFDCAKLNLQRALAMDDGYMPAFNQLALYYFGIARKHAAGGKGVGRTIATNAAIAKRGDVQTLELAILVASQAEKKNPKYAPIHNTAGLILNELGQVNRAVGEFQAAANADPKFFEANMNLAAVNLSFRGFDKAQAAYQKALAMHANDYDAHLGLALAYRGQIDDTNYDKQVALVQSELDLCKKIDPARPDAYFNEGILVQEYKAKAGGDNQKTIAIYNEAKTIFQAFTEKAGGKAEYDGALKKTKERLEDIDGIISFLSTPAPVEESSPPPAGGASDAGAAAAAGDGGAAAATPAPAASGAAAPAAPPAAEVAPAPAAAPAAPPAAKPASK